MIHIYKNDNKKYVTRGAYESFYKPLGYKIVIENKTQKVQTENVDSNIQLDDNVCNFRRTRGSSNKKNISEDNSDALQDKE